MENGILFKATQIIMCFWFVQVPMITLLYSILFVGVSDGKQIAVGTGQFEDLKCG